MVCHPVRGRGQATLTRPRAGDSVRLTDRRGGHTMSTRLDLSKLSLMDALDLASLIELEAKRRYTEFADSLGSRGGDDAGAVFRSMAVNETKHCDEIAERRVALFGDKPANVRIDDIFDVEAPDF